MKQLEESMTHVHEQVKAWEDKVDNLKNEVQFHNEMIASLVNFAQQQVSKTRKK